MDSIQRIIRSVMAFLAKPVFGAAESIKIQFKFALTAIDADGREIGRSLATSEPLPPPANVKWSDDLAGNVGEALASPFGPLMIPRFGDILLIIISAALFSLDPTLAQLSMAPTFCRVTTAGLNALLNSTLCNSVTSTAWYVGLMKNVSSTGVTNGTTAFTDTNGTFAAGDVGRQILIRGAGTSGGDLLTTIAAVGGSTSITLGAAASNSATGVQYALECRAADTMASHASFAESSSYSNATRPAWTPGTVSAGSVDNSASQAAFTINATDYIFGAFLTSNNTKGGSTGTLYGAGVNSNGVALAVTSGATVNVTVTATATAS